MVLGKWVVLLGACSAEIEAAEEAGQAAKAEQLRKAKRAEIIRKLRSLRRSPAPSPAKKGTSSRAAAGRAGSGSSGGGADGDKPGRAEVAEADVARIISSWTGRDWALHNCLGLPLACPLLWSLAAWGGRVHARGLSSFKPSGIQAGVHAPGCLQDCVHLEHSAGQVGCTC